MNTKQTTHTHTPTPMFVPSSGKLLAMIANAESKLDAQREAIHNERAERFHIAQARAVRNAKLIGVDPDRVARVKAALAKAGTP